MTTTNGHHQAPALLANPSNAHLGVPRNNNGPYSSNSNSNSRNSSEVSLQRVKNLPGYATPVFQDKEKQRQAVEQSVARKVRLRSSLSTWILGAGVARHCSFTALLKFLKSIHPGLHPSGTRQHRSQLVLPQPRYR